MGKMRVRGSLRCLCYLLLLPPAAWTQAAVLPLRLPPLQLYRVSVKETKSGATRTGFIDQTGQLVIGFDRLPPTTSYVGEFHDGRAVVALTDDEQQTPGRRTGSHVGFIDETGALVIAPRFTYARDFAEGLAFVRRSGFQGFIDRAGKEVAKVDDVYVGDFHDGLAAVCAAQTWRAKTCGYIDRSGQLAIARQFTFADDFAEGLAGVEVGGRVGFINRAGQMVIAPRFRPRKGTDAFITVAAGHFAEGLACVQTNERTYGYINKQGAFVLGPQFSQAQDFSEGLAWVVAPGLKVGWIDKTGRWVVHVDLNGLPAEMRGTYADQTLNWRYSEGLVALPVYSADTPYPHGHVLYEYIDQRGQVVIKPAAIDRASPFHGGLAQVFFYEQPRIRQPPVSAQVITNEYVPVDRYGYIDRMGRLVWPAQ